MGGRTRTPRTTLALADATVTIPAFDLFLAARGLRLEAVVIGGTALNLLGVVSRETRDCDVLAPPLSAEVLAAARAFALERRAAGDILRDDWLNNGHELLGRQLPPGWEQRVEVLFNGRALPSGTGASCGGWDLC